MSPIASTDSLLSAQDERERSRRACWGCEPHSIHWFMLYCLHFIKNITIIRECSCYIACILFQTLLSCIANCEACIDVIPNKASTASSVYPSSTLSLSLSSSLWFREAVGEGRLIHSRHCCLLSIKPFASQCPYYAFYTAGTHQIIWREHKIADMSSKSTNT